MRLKQTQNQRQVQQYRLVLRNFFLMISSLLVLTSLSLVMLITSADSTKSYAKADKSLIADRNK
jgi:hypothetical protein